MGTATEAVLSESSDDSSTDSSDDSSCSSTTTISDGSRGRHSMRSPLSEQHAVPPAPDTEYAAHVQEWALRVPIGLGLCPWAAKSHCQGLLRYVTCGGTNPADVARLIAAEAEQLNSIDAAPLSTTLIVCPHVEAWHDFKVFDNWLDHGIHSELHDQSIHDKLTFVSFHPDFLRWRGLAESVEVGSKVQSYWGVPKSLQRAAATVLECSTKVFGARKIKVRFEERPAGCRQEQFVSIDWLDQSVSGVGQPLPDNAMHRAPYPTVHLIRNCDLASLCMRDVSRVKRRNAQRMQRLGWEGIQKRLGMDNGVDRLSSEEGCCFLHDVWHMSICPAVRYFTMSGVRVVRSCYKCGTALVWRVGQFVYLFSTLFVP